MNTEFTLTQRRALAIFTLLALAFGAYFLRNYFVLIVVAAVGAYLFTPLFNWFNKRLGTGLSATATLLSALVIVIVPVGLLVALAIVQIARMIDSVSGWVRSTDLSSLGDKTLKLVNEFLSRVPFVHINVTAEMLRKAMVSAAQGVGHWLLGVLQNTAGSLAGMITSAIIFLYVFIALLVHRDKLRTLIGQLNPLGDEVTDLYLQKMGSMVRGTVNGQFVIAFCQGVAGAASIYIAGFHHGFFIFAIVLTALSIIPLGGGIITIPFGIGMMLFGNIGGGLFVVLFHLVVVTNIDNFLRPILVPRDARLNSALMLLSVFAGISMFGPWGIIIGPVLMIIIVTTIDVYLAVYKGVELKPVPDKDTDKDTKKDTKKDTEKPVRSKWSWRAKSAAP
ncbi:AI-2E family transporter [Mycobacterium paragordonae]|uniref:AI-2E family transporter n=1 Tax=Mycobacterium paragordonae TaxID=1389713 RepID=UPI0012E181AB|nr:AI-2E family transporter [Mycobacterium paragordonae]